MEDDREIWDTLDELDFIIVCETTTDEIEAQRRSYQANIEESQLYQLWQTEIDAFSD